MKRHYCTFCNSKRNESQMVLLESRLLKKSGWICREHLSATADITTIRSYENKKVFVELFSGSRHVSEKARQRGFDTVTIDIEDKFNPDICIDIHNLRRQQLPGTVDIIWASIPCTVYSILSVAHHWTKVNLGYRQYYYLPKTKQAIEALRILNKTISLIKRIKPIYYFIENPRGALRHLPHLKFVPYRKTVSYADYGFEYYKPTDIFTNCSHFQPKEITGAMGREFSSRLDDLNSKYERSLIPPKLIDEVLDSIDFLNTRCVA